MSTVLILVTALAMNDEITFDRFSDEYKKSSAISAIVYNNLRIEETKQWTASNAIEKRHAQVCGDYVMVRTESLDPSSIHSTTLCKELYLSIRKNTKSGEWALVEHLTLDTSKSDTHAHTYRSLRNKISRQLPDAFVLPFSSDGNDVWQDVMDRIQRKDKRVQLEWARTVRQDSSTVYRVCYSYYDETGNPVAFSFLDFDPALGWMIVRGGSKFTEAPLGVGWSIEYGYEVKGVPVMKSSSYCTAKIDESAGGFTFNATDKPIVVTVTRAEDCQVVDEKEYKPEHYGIELPIYYDPRNPPELPASMYIALGGILCFIAGILLIHLSKQRARRSKTRTALGDV